MDHRIADELKAAFDLASLRKEAATLKRSGEWGQITQLTARCERARAREERNHAALFDTRVEVAKRRLVDEAASTQRRLKPLWFGEDRFDGQALHRQAQRVVIRLHEKRLARIDEHERRSLSAIVEGASRNNNLADTMKGQFERATDRRDGEERRDRTKSRTR